jgi:hypothetical protein
MAETSQDYRLTRTIEVQGHAGVSGIGVSGGFYLPEDSRIDVKWSQGDTAFLGFDEKSIKLEFQSFTRNSLYYAFGLHHRRLHWDQSFSSVTTYKDEFLERSDTRSEGLYFVVGNEWTLGNFVIGGEWFGMSQPLLRQTDNAYTTIATDSDRKRSQRRMDDRLRMPSFIQPSLVLGFSF